MGILGILSTVDICKAQNCAYLHVDNFCLHRSPVASPAAKCSPEKSDVPNKCSQDKGPSCPPLPHQEVAKMHKVTNSKKSHYLCT